MATANPVKENIIGEYMSITKEYSAIYGDKTILLLQVGVFMEMYALAGSDNCVVEQAVQQCGLNMADKKQMYETTDGKKYTVMMAGFRDYMIEKYLKILTDNGYTSVVFIQQKTGKIITRVFDAVHSPGTHIGYDLIVNRSNNIMCIWMETYNVRTSVTPIFICGIAVIDCITGISAIFEFQLSFLLNPTMCDELERMVAIYQPNEVISISKLDKVTTNTILQYSGIRTPNIHYNDLSLTTTAEFDNIQQEKYVKQLLAVLYGEDAYDICGEFKENPISTQAFCYLLHFVQGCNKDLVKRIAIPTLMNTSTRVVLANHTLKQLNIIDDSSDDGIGHLSSVMSFLNRCQTAGGKRRFRSHITNPVFDEEWLNTEYNMIAAFMDYAAIPVIRQLLASTYDIEKIARQLVLRKLYPSTIFGLYQSLESVFKICRILENSESHIDEYLLNITPSASLRCMQFIESWLKIEQCRGINTIQIFDENIIQPGMSNVLDSIQRNYTETKDLFDAIQAHFNILMNRYDNNESAGVNTEYVKVHETEKSGISLVITKKRGALLKSILHRDVSNTSFTIGIHCIPIAGISFTTVTGNNDEIRFPLLTDVCHKLHSLKEQLNAGIATVFQDFLVIFEQQWYASIINIAKYIAKLDVLQSKVYVAREYGYCRPVIINDDGIKPCIIAKDLRHTLIEQIQQKEIYVANDIAVGNTNSDNTNSAIDGMLIYGTNAVGKTSLIRATGVAVIMAQAGMYVPATEFRYKPYQSIYTRILGNDNLFKGLSTFAVEMSELRIILKMADKNSLVLGDELCSGTETESALSIFVAGLEHLHAKSASFLFATHFHEILKFDEIKSLGRMAVYHLAVVYSPELDTLVYDRKLRVGSGSRLYGLEVCKSLYLPQDFLDVAHRIRIKYFPETRGELDNPVSNYNAQKVRGICEICNVNMGQEIHHLQEQQSANADGLINDVGGGGLFHKNHLANLISICESCHDTIHSKSPTATISSNVVLQQNVVKKVTKMVKKKTLLGYRII